jgi:SAM-dependent methyltransferase
MIATLTDDSLHYASRQPWLYEDNGFSSMTAMDVCHQPILECVAWLIGRANDEVIPGPLRVLDLGCGNGVLAARIAWMCRDVEPAGVDIDLAKIARARQLFPSIATAFRVGNLYDLPHLGSPGTTNHVIILMLGRLSEIGPACARALLDHLCQRTRHLLVYAYRDYLRHTMSFAAMAHQLGLELESPRWETNTGARDGQPATVIGVVRTRHRFGA